MHTAEGICLCPVYSFSLLTVEDAVIHQRYASDLIIVHQHISAREYTLCPACSIFSLYVCVSRLVSRLDIVWSFYKAVAPLQYFTLCALSPPILMETGDDDVGDCRSWQRCEDLLIISFTHLSSRSNYKLLVFKDQKLLLLVAYFG